MGFLNYRCKFSILDEKVIKECQPFSCGNADLDDFFRNESFLYNNQLLGKSYCFRLEEDPSVIVCAFTLANDSIKVDLLPNNRKKLVRKNIPHTKQIRRYPGILIGRLGVNEKFAHRGIGSELMDFIKLWFVDGSNKAACRFILVDAYNEDIQLAYYQKNGFKFLFSSEEQEKEFTPPDSKPNKLQTRLMYFDLISIWCNILLIQGKL